MPNGTRNKTANGLVLPEGLGDEFDDVTNWQVVDEFITEQKASGAGSVSVNPATGRIEDAVQRRATQEAAGAIRLSEFGITGSGNEFAKLKQAADAAFAANVPLLIDRSLSVAQSAVTDTIRIPAGQTVEFIGSATITQTTFGLPLFWSTAVNPRIINPRIMFSGTIPVALPAVTSSFKSLVQADVAGVSVVPEAEFTAAIGLWRTTDAKVIKPVMGSASSDPTGCMHICIDTWNTVNTTVEDAAFDGYIMGILGSRNQAPNFTARGGRRSNITSTRSWSPPGHVVYVSPTGTSDRTQGGWIVVFDGNQMLAGTDNSSTASVKINDADDLDVFIKSSFPRGGLTIDGLSNSRVVMHHTPGQVTYPAGNGPVRMLATTNQSFGNTLDLTFEIPDGFADYVELGQASGGVARLTTSEIRIKFTHLGTNIALGTELLRLNGTACNLNVDAHFPNATSGTLTLLNIWNTGSGNDAKVAYSAPSYSTYNPVVRCDSGDSSITALNRITGERYELNGGAVRRTRVFTANVTPAAGATNATVTAFIPRGYRILSLGSRITAALTGTTGYNVGDGSTANRFGGRSSTGVGGTTTNANWNSAGAAIELADMNLVITAQSGTFDGVGTVRVVAEAVSNA